ncbi:MAG: DUF3300 domain-containing protein [Candidatus Binataceae bacterium]
MSSLPVVWAQAEDLEAPARLPADQLDQLVAPIALYPDSLVAQVLAGATYPSQVTEANNWLSSSPGLSGERLAAAVDTQPWDPSIKALTQFPSVVAKMATNLTWTSALGEAYYYQPQDVLNAVQVMRQRALAARTLGDTSQQKVIVENGTVIIQPANPDVVYPPTYNPWDAYGAPVPAYPGYSGADLLLAGVLGFGAGVLVGVLADQAWGWHRWGTNWQSGSVIYENNVYISRTTNFYAPNRGYWNRARYGAPRGPGERRPYGSGRPGGQIFNRPVEAGRAGVPGTWSRPAENAHPEVGGEPRPNAPAQPVSRPEAPAREAALRPAEIPNTNPAMPNRNPGNERAPVPAVRNNPRPQAAPAANAFRGFGKAPATGLKRTAFAGYSAGGEARAATVRGHSSLQASAARRAPAPAAHNAGRAATSSHKH